MNKAGVSFVLGVPKDFYVLRYSELRRHQRLKNKFSQRFYFSSSCSLLPRDVNAVWKKKGTLTRLLLRGGREGQVYVKFCFTDGVTECAKLSCYQQAQSHRVRWSHRAQSLSTWKEEMTTCRRRCLSAPPVGEASACVCRSPQSETRGKQAAGRVHPRAPLMRMTVSALCLLWEGMDLMRLPVTEVVAVSVLHGSTGQKKNTKTQHKRAALHNHSLQVVHWLLLLPPVLDLLVGPMWGKERKPQWWATWLAVTSEVTGTVWAAGILTVCSHSQEVQRSAQRHGRLHQKPPPSGSEGRRTYFICREKSFSNRVTSVPTFEREPCE